MRVSPKSQTNSTLGLGKDPTWYRTLAHCKFGTSRRRNIVELADVGDWIVGTGGVGPQSAGHGKLIYAMCVSEKLTLRDYFADRRFRGRADNLGSYARRTNRFVLVSEDFFYFGIRARDLSKIPSRHLVHPFEKRGPGFRSDFSGPFITDFAVWLRNTFGPGVHALPCGGRPTHAPRVICPARQG
jgi:hypothetical protein